MYRKLIEGEEIEIVHPAMRGGKESRERLTVIKHYDNYVRCRNASGHTVCVQNGDLIRLGIISQDDGKEELRREVSRRYGAWHKKG